VQPPPEHNGHAALFAFLKDWFPLLWMALPERSKRDSIGSGIVCPNIAIIYDNLDFT
jgi:hypothetical protein